MSGNEPEEQRAPTGGDGQEAEGHDPASPQEAEHAVCSLCGADDPRLLYTRRDERLRVDERVYGVVICRRCGLGYLDPVPSREALRRYYPDGYFARRGQPGRGSRRYKLQAGYVREFAPGRLLEIGCAAGAFLRIMRDQGWKTVGVDTSEKAGNPYGLDLRYGEFLEMPFDPGSFDLITAWDVFEHLYDPKAYFRRAAGLLAEGGALVVAVPNLRWPGSRWGQREDVPRHLHFFTSATLSRMAAAAGLKTTRVLGDFSMKRNRSAGWLRVPLYARRGLTYREYRADRKRPFLDRLRARPGLTLLCGLLSPLEDLLANRLLLAATGRAPELVGYFAKS